MTPENLLRSLAVLLAGCLLCATPGFAAERTDYRVDYHVRFLPNDNAAEVRMEVRPGSGRAKRFRFTMPPDRYKAIKGDDLKIDGDRVVWNVAEAGGEMRYRVQPIDQARNNGALDARMTADWAIVRGDDLFPSAAALLTKGADSRTRLHFELPNGWSFVDTGYSRSRDGKSFVITNSERAFDRPVGWIIAGKIGSRREQISGVEVVVAAPRGSDVERTVTMAICSWILPEMQLAFGDLPGKILIVGADDPMWRGGLSSPNSLFMHSSRPVISGNYTSTLVHELVHITTRIRDEQGFDWITEGLAEYYSAELLRRSGGMTEERFQKVLDFMADWGKDVKTLKSRNSKGPRTATAVGFFHQLDAEIRQRTNGAESLDAVVRRLMKQQKVNLNDLQTASEAVADGPLQAFGSSLLNAHRK